MRTLVINDREDESTLERNVREELLKKLIGDWNSIDATFKQTRYRFGLGHRDERQNFIDNFIGNTLDDAYLDGVEDEDDLNKIAEQAMEKAKLAYEEELKKPAIKMDLIEQQIHALDARLARPYEHWNEQEKEIEYLETKNDAYYYDCDNDYDYDD